MGANASRCFWKRIYVSESHHSAAWGAAWTALVAIGKVDSFEEIKQNIPIEASLNLIWIIMKFM